MRGARGLLLLGALALAGCSAAKATTPIDAPKTASAPAIPAAPFALELKGALAQGGMAAGRTAPLAKVTIDDIAETADAAGNFVIGFDRDASPTARLTVIAPNGHVITRTLTIEQRSFQQTVVNGLPPAMVTPPPEVLTRIKEETGRKSHGFASMAQGFGFAQPFVWPIAGRISSPWGAQRILNGELNRPHYGVDIAAPVGTPISAPAGGVIAFAEPELYYEGGLIMIDHGHGLISLYLHMSELNVRAGDQVAQGQLIGRVGNKGRTTGPHLCWRMKWRGRNLDPSLAVVAAGGPSSPALNPS